MAPVPGSRHAATLLAVAIAATLLVRAYQKHSRPAPVLPRPAMVNVQGEVPHPGLYMFDSENAPVPAALKLAGAEAGDTAAGSPTADAVHEGIQIRVSRSASGKLGAEVEPLDGPIQLTLGKKLDLNQASESDLCLVPQMKPEVAAQIVSRRSTKRWGSLSELQEIPGVGPKTTMKWENYLQAGGVKAEPSHHPPAVDGALRAE